MLRTLFTKTDSKFHSKFIFKLCVNLIAFLKNFSEIVNKNLEYVNLMNGIVKMKLGKLLKEVA